jgi:release factor glutamine methyltransferase
MHSIKSIFVETYSQLLSYYKNNNIAYSVANQLIKLVFTYDYIILSKSTIINNEIAKILKEQVYDITVRDMPYQYILGEISFCNTIIKLKPPVLIPRIETEALVFWVIEKLSIYKKNFLNIIDFCSGSGCIGIALLGYFINSRCTAFDICQRSVELSSYNARINNLKSRYTIYQKDIFTLKKNKKYDIIISNPPYISLTNYRQLDNSVKEWESRNALTDEENGYRHILHILKISKNKLNKDAIIIIEICDSNADFILQEAHKTYPNELAFLWSDQYNKKRALIIAKGEYKSSFLDSSKNLCI